MANEGGADRRPADLALLHLAIGAVPLGRGPATSRRTWPGRTCTEGSSTAWRPWTPRAGRLRGRPWRGSSPSSASRPGRRVGSARGSGRSGTSAGPRPGRGRGCWPRPWLEAQRGPARPFLAALRGRKIDLSGWAREVLAGRPEEVARGAEAAGLDASLVASALRLALLPALAPISAGLDRLRPEGAWDRGDCPNCGSRPLLAESRGLEQRIFYRCGRLARRAARLPLVRRERPEVAPPILSYISWGSRGAIAWRIATPAFTTGRSFRP